MEYIRQLWEKVPGINYGIIPMCVVYSAFSMASGLLFPFLSLQALSIGLDLNDISIIYGIQPIITITGTTIMGIIGDKCGYKLAYSLALIFVMFGTVFNFIPKYHDFVRTPHANVSISGNSYVIDSLLYPPKNCTNDVTNVVSSCSIDDNTPLTDLWCRDHSKNWTRIPSLNFPPNTPLSLNSTFHKGNGTFCLARYTADGVGISQGSDLTCVFSNPSFQSCEDKEGTHSVTFGLYLLLCSIFQVGIMAGNSLSDSSALECARRYDSSFSYIFLVKSIFEAIVPTFGGYFVRESSNPQVPNDYSLNFYVADVLCLISILIIIFKLRLEVPMGRGLTMKSSMKSMINPAIIIYVGIGGLIGILTGITDQYVAVFLTRDLGADSKLIGASYSVAITARIFGSLFANPIIKFVGMVNIMVIGALTYGLRLVLYAVIRISPPYHSYVLSTFDFLANSIPWIACIGYCHRVAPPNLVATMVSVTAATQFAFGRGAGGLLGGQLVQKLTFPQVFLLVGTTLGGLSVILRIFYKIFGQKHEDAMIRKRNDILAEIDDNNLIDCGSSVSGSNESTLLCEQTEKLRKIGQDINKAIPEMVDSVSVAST